MCNCTCKGLLLIFFMYRYTDQKTVTILHQKCTSTKNVAKRTFIEYFVEICLLRWPISTYNYIGITHYRVNKEKSGQRVCTHPCRSPESNDRKTILLYLGLSEKSTPGNLISVILHNVVNWEYFKVGAF